MTTPASVIVATDSSSDSQVTVAPATGLPPEVTLAESEPAAVPFLRSVLVIPVAEIVVSLAVLLAVVL